MGRGRRGRVKGRGGLIRYPRQVGNGELGFGELRSARCDDGMPEMSDFPPPLFPLEKKKIFRFVEESGSDRMCKKGGTYCVHFCGRDVPVCLSKPVAPVFSFHTFKK